MRTREELIGAEVLALVDRFHPDGRHRHARHRVRKTLGTTFQALAMYSLAHQLVSTRGRRLALATGGYLHQEKRKRRRERH